MKNAASRSRRISRSWKSLVFSALLTAAAGASNVDYAVDPASGRVTRADYSDGTYVLYGYDENGNRTSATVVRPADTQVPSAPSTLTHTVVSATRIDLSWQASSDNVGVTGYRVERCQGASCSNFGEIGQPTATTFQNSGLTSAVTYRYRVRATDAAGNLSGYSNIVTGTTTDNVLPTAPGAPTFTNVAATSVTANWTAATDNVGVTGYQYRLNGGTWVSTGSTALSFNITGLTASTTYTVAIRARDQAANFGPTSGNGTVTTSAPPDTTAPTAPGTPTFTNLTATSVTANWTAATDNVGVTGYQYRLNGGTWVSTGSTALSFNITGLTASTTYTVAIRARDQAGNFGASSGNGTVTTPAATDTTPPTTPGTPTFSSITLTGATANWTASTDNVAVTGYQYSLNGGAWTNTGSASPTFAITGLTAGTAYTFAVRARDAAGNTGTASGNGSFTTTADTTAPTAPGTPTFSSIAATSIVASWMGSTDNVGVTGYQYRLNGGTWVSTGSTSTSHTITGLTNGTTYTVAIRARDQAGNFGSPSGNGTVTTLDNAAPSAPGTPSFSSIAATSAVASWTASTDNVAVTGYEYSLNGGAWTSTGSASASFTIGGLTSATNYTFAVRARDAADNIGTASAAGSFTTLDNVAPSAPGTPGFSSVTATGASASWSASSDNVAVTGYEYSLNGGGWTSTGSASPGVGLSGLSGSTTYSLAVRARDAAGNLSAASSAGSFTTLDNSPPSAPGTPGFSSVTHNSANASWSASSDNVGVTGYDYSLNGGSFTATGSSSPAFALSGLSASTPYSLVVRARDAAGNLSAVSGTGSFTTAAPPDTTAPSAPGTPAFSNVTATTATLSWGAASDNVAVTGYDYSLNGGGSWTNAGAGLSVNLTGLSAATTYGVQVRARDAAGNIGSVSSASLSTIAQITISNLTVTSDPPMNPQVVYVLQTSGDIHASPSNAIPPVDTGLDWLTPKIGMGNFQAMASGASGCQTGSYNTWLNLSVGVSWARVNAGTCTFTLQIRHSSNPSVILDTATITLIGQ